MFEQWVKPGFQQVCVNGECTAYAGRAPDAAPERAPSGAQANAVQAEASEPREAESRS